MAWLCNGTLCLGISRDFVLPETSSIGFAVLSNFAFESVCAGTPQGVGPVKAGQKITAGITDLIDVHFNVEKRKRAGSC